MQVHGSYIKREENENIVAITDSVSYKMIREHERDKFTFAFKTITPEEAERMINENASHCVGTVGHHDFAKDLNRVLNLEYHIPYGRGRERVHLTLTEGDYLVIISRNRKRAKYTGRWGYVPLNTADDAMFTLAKVIRVPEVEFELCSLNET